MSDQQHWQQPRTEYHVASPPPVVPQAQPDIRTSLITKIWGCATGMMALCIPLMAIISDTTGAAAMLLPVAVVAGATVSTSVIWLTGPPSTKPPALPPAVDPRQLQELEQRLYNLETIDRYERLSYAEKMARLDPAATGYQSPARPVQPGMR